MIQKAEDVLIGIHGLSLQALKIQKLKEWAESIIDECGSTFKWEWDCQDEHDAVEIVDVDTIQEVKNQL